MSRPTVLLDTCVLLSLLASGESEPVLSTLRKRWLICAAVEKESIYLRNEDPNSPLVLVSLMPLIAAGLLEVCDVETEDEARLYVNYATRLDDGEAMSVALAIARGYYLATDDRKARRIFLETGARERLTCLTQLMRDWTETAHISRKRARTALLEIVNKARFSPSEGDKNREWWDDLVRVNLDATWSPKST
jgi:predicted nucleic acid-binding protein